MEMDNEMITNNLKYVYLTHSAEMVKNEIECHCISHWKLAEEMEVLLQPVAAKAQLVISSLTGKCGRWSFINC